MDRTRVALAAAAFVLAAACSAFGSDVLSATAATWVAVVLGVAGAVLWYLAARSGPAVLGGASVVAAIQLAFATAIIPRYLWLHAHGQTFSCRVYQVTGDALGTRDYGVSCPDVDGKVANVSNFHPEDSVVPVVFDRTGWAAPEFAEEMPLHALSWWALLLPLVAMAAWLVTAWRVRPDGDWRHVWYRFSIGVGGFLLAALWAVFGSAVAGGTTAFAVGMVVAFAALFAVSSVALRAGNPFLGFPVMVAVVVLGFTALFGPYALWMAANGRAESCRVGNADSDTSTTKYGGRSTSYAYDLDCPSGPLTIGIGASHRTGDTVRVLVDRTGLARPVPADDLPSTGARVWFVIGLLVPAGLLAAWGVTAARYQRQGLEVAPSL